MQPFLKELDTLNLRVCFLFQRVLCRNSFSEAGTELPPLAALETRREIKR